MCRANGQSPLGVGLGKLTFVAAIALWPAALWRPRPLVGRPHLYSPPTARATASAALKARVGGGHVFHGLPLPRQVQQVFRPLDTVAQCVKSLIHQRRKLHRHTLFGGRCTSNLSG